MPNTSTATPSTKSSADQSFFANELGQAHLNNANLDIEQMQLAFAQFNRLSESLVSSYQTLEGQVETLADRLANEVKNKQQQLHEKERIASRLQSLLSILPAGVVVLDDKGFVQECNAVAVDLLGRPLVGERWITIIDRNFAPRLDDGHEISLKDGRRVRIETRALSYEPGQLIVITDLTETRNLQDKINQDKRLSSMGKMMASLAHQIRTPLSAAMLYASNLSEKTVEPEVQLRFGKKLSECLYHLERHVNDMLQFARSGGLVLTQISTGQFIEALIKHLNNVQGFSEITGDIENESFMMINTDSLFSAITNLIDNATHATQSREAPEINLSFGVKDSNFWIAVKDNGIGITADQQLTIFDPFVSYKPGGTGLGLAVVHGVVKAHHGHIKVNSNGIDGSEFVIQLPLVKSVPDL